MKRRLVLFLTLFFVGIGIVTAQTQVRGIVVDESGEPVIGATIQIKGTSQGTVTDVDGNFNLSAPASATLVVSYVGYETQEVPVSASVNVVLVSGTELDEVVVVGYGTQRRSEVTSSIASVKGDDLANLNAPSFDQLLAGRAAGVQVTQNSGLLGTPPRVFIRGNNTLSSGNQPLYVVDGVPVASGDFGLNIYTNALADINPADIESVDILKDGAATAIYGSRGQNGVVLITTKKGKGGKFTVNFNHLTAVAQVSKYFDLLNTDQFLEISAEKGRIANRPDNYWAEGDDYDTDWQKAVLRTGIQTDNSLNFSGDVGRGKYYASLGYANQEGIIKSNSQDRITAKLSADQKIFSDRVTIGVDLNLAKTKIEGLNTSTSALSGAMYNALKQHPNVPIYDANNSTGYNIDLANNTTGWWDNNAGTSTQLTNIVYVLDHNVFENETFRILGNTFADIRFTDWLNYRFQVGADNAFSTELLYYNKVHGDGVGNAGLIRQYQYNRTRWNIQHLANINKSFGDHNFLLTLINEYQKQDHYYFYGGGNGLSSDFFNENLITGSYETQVSGGSKTQQGFISYAARFNYNFASKYFLQASLRRDGLSNLADGKKWGSFPGVSAGWTVSREGFFDNIRDSFSELKLRASWAKTGNSNLASAYLFQGLFANARYGDATGIAYDQTANPELTWESSDKYDVGLDFGFLNNRITASVDYYRNDIDNLVLARTYPASIGLPYDRIYENIGAVLNHGFEFSVDAEVIRRNDFSWNVGVNFSTLKNKVLTLPDGNDIFPGSYTIYREGEAANSLWGWRYWGVNPANGNPVHYKADGTLVQSSIATNGAYYVFDPDNPTDLSTSSTLAESDKTILGQTVPKFFGSVTNTFRYKNFDLSALIRYNYGNKILNLTRSELLSQDFFNNSTEILGRWQSPENPGDGITPVLRAGYGARTNIVQSSRFVESGDFIKFDNLTLGYTFDKQLIERIKISNLRLFVQAQNAIVITKYKGPDPESYTASYTSAGVDLNAVPRQRSFSFGLNVSF